MQTQTGHACLETGHACPGIENETPVASWHVDFNFTSTLRQLYVNFKLNLRIVRSSAPTLGYRAPARRHERDPRTLRGRSARRGRAAMPRPASAPARPRRRRWYGTRRRRGREPRSRISGVSDEPGLVSWSAQSRHIAPATFFVRPVSETTFGGRSRSGPVAPNRRWSRTGAMRSARRGGAAEGRGARSWPRAGRALGRRAARHARAAQVDAGQPRRGLKCRHAYPNSLKDPQTGTYTDWHADWPGSTLALSRQGRAGIDIYPDSTLSKALRQSNSKDSEAARRPQKRPSSSRCKHSY